MAAIVKQVSAGEAVSATSYNELVATTNMVRNMTGNVIKTDKGIHIPFSKKFKDTPISYKAIPAYCLDGESHIAGTIVRIVSAYKPQQNEQLEDGWVAVVCDVEKTTAASGAKGHLGYGVVTKAISYDGVVGEIAIAGEVPALVKHPSGMTTPAVAPGYRYAVVDVNNATASEREYLKIYGKHKFGTVPAFRVLYEDTSGTLTDLHWALVKVDMGNEIDDQCTTVKNDFTSAITDGQPAMIKEHEDGYLVVDRPSENSIPAPRIVFPVGVIGASTDNPYGFARAGSEPIWVEYAGTAPAIGDDVGTQTDSFKFKKGNTGFMCVGVDAGGSKCLVRPFSSGTPVKFTYIYTGFYNPSVGPFSGTGGYENMYSSWTDLTYPIDITTSQMTMYTDASNVTATYTFASDARLTFDLSYYIQLGDADENVLGTFAFDRPKTTCNVEGGTPLYVTKNISDGVAGIFASTQSYSIGNTTADTTATKFRTRFYVKYIYEATTTSATISAYFGKIALSSETVLVDFVTPA